MRIHGRQKVSGPFLAWTILLLSLIGITGFVSERQPRYHQRFWGRPIRQLIRPSSSFSSTTCRFVLPSANIDLNEFSTYHDYSKQLEHLAKTTSQDPSAIQLATDLVDRMLAERITPDITIYNSLLEVYAYSKDPDGANQAERILSQMTMNENLPRPNLESYGKIMDAWTRRRRLEKVEEIFQLLVEVKQNENNNNNDDDPSNPLLYNKLIKAYGSLGEAEKAEALLDELLERSESKGGEVNEQSQLIRPNYKTWVHVLRAYGNPKYKTMALEKIRSLIQRMERGYYENGHKDWNPTTVQVNNALLRAISLTPGQNNAASAKEAEKLLYEMIARYKEQGGREMRPTADSFYHVILAFRNLSDGGVPFKIEKLLELQTALLTTTTTDKHDNNDGDDLRPTLRTYRAAISAMTRTRDPRQAIRAKNIMDKLHEAYNAGDKSFAPDLATYNFLLKSCAYTSNKHADPEIKLEAFKIAIETLNELRDSDRLTPDSSTFSLFLKACESLMPPSRKRDAVIENVFLQCCKDGHLNEYVLREFEKAASSELQLRVLGGFLEDGVQPPADWSRNAVEK